MDPIFIAMRYRIFIDGSYMNEKQKVPLNQAQVNNFNFQVANIFGDILKRKTGQIIVEGIRSTGWAVVIRPYTRNVCNSDTHGGAEMIKGRVNVVVRFKLDTSCFVDSKTKDFKPGGSPAEVLFHELVHAFRLVTEKDSNRWGPSKSLFT
jgi:hypothetical protein